MTMSLPRPPALRMRGLSVTLPGGADRRLAVEDLDLDIAWGEIVCLVGESGSGKSVASFAVMGLLPPGLAAQGSIRVAGEEIVGADERRLTALRGRRMAMVFQEPMTALNPVMRCGDQIAEAFRADRARPRLDVPERVRALLAEVGLDEAGRVARAYPHQLSGGQRQRVVIAMALALEPDLLVADEPTTALDVTTQAQILDLVRTIARERGTGILFVTHDFGVVETIADRIVVLKGGRAVEQGARQAVLRRPAHCYTRTLINAVPDLVPRPARRTAAAPLLEVEGLGKTYRTLSFLRAVPAFRAADDVSFAIPTGETMGLVGESGSGKSTVARCIARLIAPDSGAVRIGGDDIARLGRRALQSYRRRVQIVFQDPYRSLNPRRTVGEALIEGPMNFGVPRARALDEAARLLELVRLDPSALERRPRQFSGGQRQRICVARALAMEPELLIADEALSALDVSVQAEMLALFEDLRARLGLTMLFITHDLRVAARLCDTIAVMRRGRIVEAGETASVFARPSHPYTAALLAAVPGRDAAEAAEPAAARKQVGNLQLSPFC